MAQRLFQEYKIYGKYQEQHGDKVVPLQALSFEKYWHYDAEYKARDYLLYHFQLHKREGAAVYLAADAVCGD